jgi:hypothetical protein
VRAGISCSCVCCAMALLADCVLRVSTSVASVHELNTSVLFGSQVTITAKITGQDAAIFLPVVIKLTTVGLVCPKGVLLERCLTR